MIKIHLIQKKEKAEKEIAEINEELNEIENERETEVEKLSLRERLREKVEENFPKKWRYDDRHLSGRGRHYRSGSWYNDQRFERTRKRFGKWAKNAKSKSCFCTARSYWGDSQLYFQSCWERHRLSC